MRNIVVCEIGGTFSMGMVLGSILKKLSYVNLIDNEKYAALIFDIRHFVLAAKIVSSKLYVSQKNNLLIKLVETAQNFSIEEKDTNICLQKHHNFLNNITRRFLGVNSVNAILNGYHLNLNTISPYRIDSIDFSNTEHHNDLLNIANQAFKNSNTTLIVIGGTDSQEFYAGMLARDLDKRGYFCSEKGNSVLFLSSMLSFGYDDDMDTDAKKAVYPAHIGKYILAAIEFSKQKQEGAFSMAAKDKRVSVVYVHDVLSNFVKISSVLPNAFRSSNALGQITITNGTVDFTKKNSFIEHHHRCVPDENLLVQYGSVSPPIINLDAHTFSALLKALNTNPHPFKTVIIELNKDLLISLSNDAAAANIAISHYKRLTNKGVRIIWFNEASFQQKTGNIESRYTLNTLREFKSFNSTFLSVKTKSELVDNKTLIGVYLDQLFRSQPNVTSESVPIESLIAKIPVLGIKYVPDDKSFQEMLHIASKLARSVVISALPGEVLPARHEDLIKKMVRAGTEVYVCFKYNGMEYNDGNSSFIEGSHENHYAAAQFNASIVKSCGTLAPNQMINKIRVNSRSISGKMFDSAYRAIKQSAMTSIGNIVVYTMKRRAYSEICSARIGKLVFFSLYLLSRFAANHSTYGSKFQSAASAILETAYLGAIQFTLWALSEFLGWVADTKVIKQNHPEVGKALNKAKVCFPYVSLFYQAKVDGIATAASAISAGVVAGKSIELLGKLVVNKLVSPKIEL